MSGHVTDQGLSIFDWTAGPQFPEVRRFGYDPVAVDAFVRAHADDGERVRAEAEATLAERGALRKEVARLTAELTDAGVPTASGTAARVAKLLVDADANARQSLIDADTQAEQICRDGEAAAVTLREEAAAEIESARTTRLTDVEADRERAKEDAEQERANARSAAEELRARAREEAEQRRHAATEEATAMRSAATREADDETSTADREVAAARSELSETHASRLQEAETTHVRTRDRVARLADKAEEACVAVEKRSREAIAQAAGHRDASRAESERLVARARRHANQLVTEARSTVGQDAATRIADMERRTARIQSEIDDLRRQEDGMRIRIAELRSMAKRLDHIDKSDDSAEDD